MNNITTKLWCILLLCLTCMSTNAQNCPQRYVDDLFAVERIEEPANYGTASALVGPYLAEFLTNQQNLSFDFYQPVGDDLSERPLIIMAFGGAFLVGDKRQAELVDYCEALARKGYCVASIDYRKGFNVLSTNSAIRAVYRGAQDFKAAVRYFRANAAVYGIDPNKIIGGGASAGAISAINAAYLEEADRVGPTTILQPTYNFPDLGCLDCSGNNLNVSSIPNAVVNLWGGIGELEWINAGEAPIVSFHGTADNTVSAYTASPFNYPIFPSLSGSVPIHERANLVGLVNELNLYQGEGHEMWNEASLAIEIQEKSAEFLANLMPPVYLAGGTCDDGDVCTTNDVFDANCNCVGTLIDANNDGICDLNQNNAIEINVVALLSGAYDNATALMRDDLKNFNLIPTTDPYLGTTMTGNLLNTLTGNDAVVDWVLLELRSSTTNIVEQKAFLLQRDGDLIDPNTASNDLNLEANPGTYYVAIQHRNHLGVMTANPIDLSNGLTTIDFSSLQTPLWGTHSTEEQNGKRLLWAGDADANDELIYQGTNNDVNTIFFYVLGDAGNVNSNVNYISTAYANADLNMDGQVIYQGVGNDPNENFFAVLTHPGNVLAAPNFVVYEQLP